MADLEIVTKNLDAKATLMELKGFLDAHTFEKLDQAVSAYVAKPPCRLIVDLSQVGYIGSAGAGVFIGALGKARDGQGDIVFLKPSVPVQEVLDLLGLSQIFHVASTLPEAQKFFQTA